jgi:glycosyltransferase involved in cell wall biosynthesis
MPSVGLALIVKNEEDNLPRLLESVSGAFDYVVLCDTGSTDKTVKVFREWAEREQAAHPTMGWIVVDYHWDDDFSAARNYADSFLYTDWKVWADADDTIEGAQNIRYVIENAPEQVTAFITGYDYAQHPDTGACMCFLKRERIVKRGHGQWIGRVHEAQTVQGASQYVPEDLLLWKHHKGIEVGESASRSNRRNLRILRKWNKVEPNNPRVVGYLGTEYAVHGAHKTALRYYRQYLRLDVGWADERAQICRKYAGSLMALDNHAKAKDAAVEGIKTNPRWPDSYLTLAEIAYHEERYDDVLNNAEMVLALGKPDTLLIVNPLDYTFAPLALKARALGSLGRYGDAVEAADAALAAFPDYGLAHESQAWRGVLKAERTAAQYTVMAEQLIAHDEQLKALTLLTECVPHFAIDHPKIAAMRTWLHQRIGWAFDPSALSEHYTDGGSKPEDFIPDDQVDTIAGSLPRARFLADNILEQIG